MIDYSFPIKDLEYFLLVFMRVSCFVYAAPFFGTTNVPRRVKAGLAFFLALLIFHFVLPREDLVYNTVLGYGLLVIEEASCGLLIGFMTNICMQIVLFTGALTDMDIGLSMVSLFDPVSRTQTGFTGTFYQYAILLILLASNFHHYILKAFVASYEKIPVGHVIFDGERLYALVLKFLRDAFLIGFEIFLPVFGAMLVMNVVLGIMAKVSPQMNMFAVGIQLKILFGLAVMYISITLLPGIADYIFGEIKEIMTVTVDVISH
ncbi:MAG: flagellar biosynthetic protein FliR [Lachnospiraceae bacterium]|nr:flagellar biosynthetic protein FliR [Lachnospiraceae bacterium]